MPTVTLLLPDDDTGLPDSVSFAVAPREGDSVLLNVGARRLFYLVEQVFHGMTSDGSRILYFARLMPAPNAAPVEPRADAQL